jgi:RNA polymerase sigma-70 factor (ECF subfamily)
MQPVGTQKADDLTLLQRCKDGDREACEAFVLGNAPRLLRYLKSLAGNEADAEDTLQEVFASLWQKLSGPDATQWTVRHPRAYLFTTARHALQRRRRLRAGEPARMEDVETLEVLGKAAGWGADEDTETLAARLETVHQLHAALERLSEADREILVLRELEGFTNVEVSRLLGLELPAVKSRLLRARLRLAAALKRRSP